MITQWPFFLISVPYCVMYANYATVSFSCHHSSLICHKCWMMSSSYSCDMLFHITALFYHHNALLWYHLLSWQHSTLLLHHNHISCNKMPYCEITVLNSAILMSCCSKLLSHCTTKVQFYHQNAWILHPSTLNYQLSILLYHHIS